MISKTELNALRREAILSTREGRTEEAINAVFRAFEMLAEELNRKKKGGEEQ